MLVIKRKGGSGEYIQIGNDVKIYVTHPTCLVSVGIVASPEIRISRGDHTVNYQQVDDEVTRAVNYLKRLTDQEREMVFNHYGYFKTRT